ncbi:E3 ubiquitin protein ligase rie1 [Phtheirospermum japonicum]|uniref:E3 ubiquitin protein ligase rie1 n=1 Tax=Phtheirospermum japonicum TaxID=374723 RepID=A0A830CHY9_9LAMI|nr:E3 ubiquitin protein ligase rie1 [Phtheirospermum japonicum]
MGSRPGYEYRYRFWTSNWILGLDKNQKVITRSSTFSLEIRTDFILKKRNGAEEIMESERFGSTLKIFCGRDLVERHMRYRLEEYWMSDDEIRGLAQGVFDFANRLAALDQNLCLPKFPVYVDIEVYTVQLEGEPLDVTMDRLITPDRLIPLHVWPISTVGSKAAIDVDFQGYLVNDLTRIRVQDVDQGLTLMDECSICLRAPMIGAQISSLPCNHTFHNGCIVRWLLKRKLCPICRFKIVEEEEEEEEDDDDDDDDDEDEDEEEEEEEEVEDEDRLFALLVVYITLEAYFCSISLTFIFIYLVVHG